MIGRPVSRSNLHGQTIINNGTIDVVLRREDSNLGSAIESISLAQLNEFFNMATQISIPEMIIEHNWRAWMC